MLKIRKKKNLQRKANRELFIPATTDHPPTAQGISRSGNRYYMPGNSYRCLILGWLAKFEFEKAAKLRDQEFLLG
jgi:hypothetical protein